MTVTGEPDVDTTRISIRWGRIAAGAFLVELLLFATLVPLGLVFGMPGLEGATDYTVFFIAVPIGCFAGGWLVTAWILRSVISRRLLHGALIGIGASLIYLGICATQPGGIAGVIAGYGTALFWSCQALRIAGCLVGARRRVAANR